MPWRNACQRPSSTSFGDAHAITTREDGQTLLFIDRHILHEGSFHAFNQLRERGARIARPDLTFGIADHYVPTRAASTRRQSRSRRHDRAAGAQRP